MQMAIVKMSNFSLFAFDSEREDLLRELQKFGYVHFLDLDKDEALKEEGLVNVNVPESIVKVDEEIAKVKYSIDLLARYYTRESGIKAMLKGKDNYTFQELEERAASIDYEPIYDKLRELSLKADGISQEEMRLKALKEELNPWKTLNYPIRGLKGFDQSETFMGAVPKKLKDKLFEDLLDLKYTYIEAVSEDKDNVYLFALTSKEESGQLNELLRNNSFSSLKITGEEEPEKEIIKIDEALKGLEEERKLIKDSIKGVSDNLPDLEVCYEYLMNYKLRLAASENFLTTESVNVIKGFIPSDRENDFRKAVESSQKNAYYLEISEADRDDPAVPVLLKNSKFAEVFESLTSMYALPKYNEIDPTPLLAPFYLAFFGMMVADAGYGLIMLIGTATVLKLANLSEGQKKFIKFFFYLSFSTIVWGLIYGSFLGGIVPMKAFINPAEDYQDLLIISIIFGIIHLFFALGISAYMSIREKRYLDALFDVGFWFMALTGGILFLVGSFMPIAPMVKTIAGVVMVIGMVGIVLTGGRDASSIGGKLAGGVYSLYGISSYVGDFVSYSRLMALGLSGGFIASAINMMVGMLFSAGFVGVIAGIIVFIGGQIFNIFLSILGAYVHTIRLTYVEFFGKFYEGGGVGFNLFRNDPKYINLK